MRDIKIVAYLQAVSEDDERLIENYLMDKGSTRMQIYTVDPLNETIKAQGREISDLRAKIEELERDGS